MKTINFLVEDALYADFKGRAELGGMKVSGIFKLFMRAYADGTVFVHGGTLSSVDATTQVTSEPKKRGAPLKEKPVYTNMTADEQRFQAYKYPESIPPDQRKLLSYKKPEIPEHLDPLPTLYLESATADGLTYKEFFEQQWLEPRLESCSTVSDWFDITLPEFVLPCTAYKFIEDNKLKLRYRKDEIWNDIVAIDGELSVKHNDAIVAMLKKTGQI